MIASRAKRASRARARNRAVAYIRRSTVDQPQSLGEQTKAIEGWAREERVHLVRTFCDDGISGADNESRPGFLEMHEFLNSSEDVGLVVCYDLSRFGRTSMEECYSSLFDLRKLGVAIRFVTGPSPTGQPMDGLMMAVKIMENRSFLLGVSLGSIRGSLARAEMGACTGGPAPYGYAREFRDGAGKPVRTLKPGEHGQTERGGAVFLVPGGADIVEAARNIWDWYYLEKVGLDAIRDRLAKQGVPAPRGGSWRTNTISCIVRNPIYTGRLTYGLRAQGGFHRVEKGKAVARSEDEAFRFDLVEEPIVREGVHPVLVSEGAIAAFRAWEQKSRARRQAAGPRPRGNRFSIDSDYFLSGLIKCGKCGYSFVGRSSRRGEYRYRYYVCSGQDGTASGRCERFAIPADDLESQVLSNIAAAWKDASLEALAARLLRGILFSAEVERIPERIVEFDRQLGELDKKMLRILDLPDEHRDVVSVKLREIKGEQALIRKRREELQAHQYHCNQAVALATILALFLSDFPHLWKSASPQERKALIACLVKELKVDQDAKEVHCAFWQVPRMELPHFLRILKTQETNTARTPEASEPCLRRSGSGGALAVGTTDPQPALSLPYEADDVERIVARLEGGRFAAAS